jgi:Right handed beta helix region
VGVRLRYPGGSGGGVPNYGGTLTITNSTIAGNTANYGGGVLHSYYGTLTITNSTIAHNGGGGVGVGYIEGRNTTIMNSAIADNAGYGVSIRGGTITNSTIANNGGTGVVNVFDALTITNGTISGNSGGFRGGVNNAGGTLTITNSTISGNTAGGSGGGVVNTTPYGVDPTLIITNSTISGNTAGTYGGIENFGGTLTLIRTLVSGNTAPVGPEVSNFATVTADNHNLFGVDGDAGVVNFSPGPTDVVPPAGVRLPDILDPTLALHGGRTQTLALVLGSPAIDAGGPVCLDAEGNPLLTDQRGRPRPRVGALTYTTPYTPAADSGHPQRDGPDSHDGGHCL